MNLIKKIFTLTASMCLTAGVFASPVTSNIRVLQSDLELLESLKDLK